MKIECVSDPQDNEIECLEENLLTFNRSRVENYRYEDLLIKAIDRSGSMIAGIHGKIGGGWLYIGSLWVDADQRGNGMGTKLLHAAEKAALGKHCIGAYLYTYSFQSPVFYQKHGYTVMGAVDRFFGEHAKIWMRKYFLRTA